MSTTSAPATAPTLLQCPLVLGAGPGGAAAALALAQAGVPSLVVDKSAFPRDKICGDALSGKVLEALRKLGGLPLQEQLHQHFTASQAGLPSWGIQFYSPGGTCLSLPFAAGGDKPYSHLPPGYISARLHYDHWLAQQLEANDLIDTQLGTAVQSLAQTPDGILATLADGRSLLAPVVIAADGAQGLAARTLAGHQVEKTHYCAGLRQYWQGVDGLNEQGFIELHFFRRLLPGYFWIFPMPNGMANVGLGMRSDHVARHKIDLKAALADIIAHEPSISKRFAGAQALEKPRGYGLPLGSRQRQLHGERYLLVGDAASLIDPFTGEGIGNAMISGILAGREVVRLWQGGQFAEAQLTGYTAQVYRRLGSELQLSRQLQRLAGYPWLMNMVIGKAARSPEVQQLMTSMFDDVDLRARFRDPRFYFRLLFR